MELPLEMEMEVKIEIEIEMEIDMDRGTELQISILQNRFRARGVICGPPGYHPVLAPLSCPWTYLA